MEKSIQGPGKTPRIVQVMCFKGLPRQANQQPDVGLPSQQWEAQWQEFLKAAHVGWGNPQRTDAVPWDDAKTFLSAFEQVAEACQWPREEWVGRLLPALRGGVEQYVCRLDPRERQDYQKVKATLLRADAFRMELKRQHFRQCCYQELEGPRQVYGQLQELCHQWLKPERHTKEQIVELIIQEQLLAMLPPEVQGWVQERGPENCVETVALAEHFLMGRQPTTQSWDRQVPMPEATANNLETEASERQRCPEATQNANETSPARNHDVALPTEGQETARVGLVQEPLSVKEEPNLNLKPSCWEFAQENASGGSSSNTSEGLLIPPPEIISQPGQTEPIFPPGPENGEPIPYTPLGGRMLNEIKTENSQDMDTDTDTVDSFEFPFPEEKSTNHQKEQQHIPERNLSQRVQCQETSPRGRRKTVKRNGRYYPPEKRHVCSECGHKAYYLSDLLRHMKKHSEKEVYKCPVCGKTYKGKVSFEAHKKTHAVPDDPNNTNEKVGTRSSKHQIEGGYICCECGVSKATQIGLTEHMKVHRDEKPYECTECGKTFKWQSNLSRHQRLHTVGRSFARCKIMPEGPEDTPVRQGVKTLRVVLTKLASSRKGKVHRGLDCGYKADKVSELISHMRAHSRKRPYKCHECRRSFRWPSSLHQHRQNACPQKRPALSASFAEHQTTQTGEEPRGAEASLKQDIKLEEEALLIDSSPHGEPPPAAPVAECDVTLSDDEELINILGKKVKQGPKSYHRLGTASSKVNQKQRPGKGKTRQPPKNPVDGKESRYARLERKHECAECGHRTYYLSDLLRHQETHKRVKSYKCLTCGKAFKQKSALNKHQRTQPSCSAVNRNRPGGKIKKCQGEKKLICSRCGHQSYKLSTFLLHMRIHGAEKSFKCQECDQTFSWSSNLSRHMKVIHKMESSSSSRKPSFFKHRKKSKGHKKPKKAEENEGKDSTAEENKQCPTVAHGETPVIAMIRERWRYDKQEQKKDTVEENSQGEPTGEPTGEPKENLSGKEAAVRAKLVKFAYCKSAETDQGQTELSSNDTAQAGEKPCYKCLTCGKSFETKIDFTDHENTHTEPKPDTGKELGKGLSWNNNNFLKYQLIHARGKPHSCCECGKDFFCKDNLVIHLKTHGFENIFECSKCEETFVQQEQLERHRKSHEGQKC